MKQKGTSTILSAGIASIIIIAVIAGVLILGGGVYVIRKGYFTKVFIPTSITTVTVTPTKVVSPGSSSAKTAKKMNTPSVQPGRKPGASSNPSPSRTPSPNPNSDIACDPHGCISLSKFSVNISNALKNRVVGYVSIVGGLPPSVGGLARTSADPPSLMMSPELPANIASVSKILTAVAVLQLLAKDGISINAAISPYLYSDWMQGPNVSRITFKELLTHTSGFGQASNCFNRNTVTYSPLKTLVANGVQSANIGVPQYSNCNFALLRELLPGLLGQSITSLPDPQRAQQSSDLYINYVNAHVFQPLGISASACKPPAGNNAMLSYPFPAGSANGDDWGDWTLQCGSGGWVLNVNNVFRVINDLATGNVLLTGAEKKEMFAHCLGWDCSVRSDCPAPYVCKNGNLNNGSNISTWTYAGIFKCNVPVVVFVNSVLPSPYQGGEDIIGLVRDAYNHARVAGTSQACL